MNKNNRWMVGWMDKKKQMIQKKKIGWIEKWMVRWIKN